MKIKASVLPQYEVESMLELATQIQNNSNLHYVKLQKAISDNSPDFQKTCEVIEQMVINYEQQLYDAIPRLLEQCANFKKLRLGKMQAVQVQRIENTLYDVKKDSEAILSHIAALEIDKFFGIH